MNRRFSTIIVDDEPAARRIMKTLLEDHKDTIELVGEAANGNEALQLIEQLKPSLVFLDIQMPGLTGFELLDKLDYIPNIIFTTAYEQFAIQAFETFSIDYLVKPIREERLRQSIEKLMLFGKLSDRPPINNLREIVEQMRPQGKLTVMPVRTGDRIMLLKFENISHFEASDKYVLIFTIDGHKHLTDQTLSVLAEKLPEQFIRVQKSYIINKEKIREMHKYFNKRFVITMNDKSQTKIRTGLTFYDDVKAAFGL
jgi:two-component system LytT family response regulator